MTVQTNSYQTRRDALHTYFDRTAAEAWRKLTSDAPVSGIRATVRAGRDATRATVLNWLAAPVEGCTLLDAGCGPGQFSLEAAERGAHVLGVDLSPTLLDLAQERAAALSLPGTLRFQSGDMLAAEYGEFDIIVAMDSLIHYDADDMVTALLGLTKRASRQIIFTFAPRTPALTVMHGVGSLFPQGDRAPRIKPVAEQYLRRQLTSAFEGAGWHIGRSHRVSSGFYKSHVMELCAP